MNDNMQNKKLQLKELESLISGKQNFNGMNPVELSLYCEYMKRFYLSGSTNN